MPNFDTGHYFLTVLAPIKLGNLPDNVGNNVSFVQNLREKLALLPTALQSPATEEIGINSPFARNKRTHLCRFVVINNAVYNGATHHNPLVNVIKGIDPINPQKVDKLSTPFLMFAADFDAVTNEGDPLPQTLTESQQDAVRDSYAERLWETMQTELVEIFGNCVGFEAVSNASDFAAYIRKCQVETTMPFNDYWLEPPTLHKLPILPLAALVLIPLLVTVISLITWLGCATGLVTSWCSLHWSPGWWFIGGLIATLIAIWLAIKFTLWNGNKPMSAGKFASLPSVLKSLYLQQSFSEFVIDHQGKSDDDIHAAFGDYLSQHTPESTMDPSQPPGVISTARANSISSSK